MPTPAIMRSIRGEEGRQLSRECSKKGKGNVPGGWGKLSGNCQLLATKVRLWCNGNNYLLVEQLRNSRNSEQFPKSYSMCHQSETGEAVNDREGERERETDLSCIQWQQCDATLANAQLLLCDQVARYNAHYRHKLCPSDRI